MLTTIHRRRNNLALTLNSGSNVIAATTMMSQS
jgi:hypothetical protein